MSIIMNLSRFIYRNSSIQVRNISSSHINYAGHSHWQNIRHTKEAKDREKARAAGMIAKLVTKAIKDGGGSKDPKINLRLASVIEKAREMSVPQTVIKKYLDSEMTVEPYIVEFSAPGGIFLLIESVNKNVKTEREKLSGILKKYNFKQNQVHGKIVNDFFDHIGYVYVEKKNDLTTEKAFELALEVNATDVIEDKFEGTTDSFKFICDPLTYDDVRAILSEKSYSILDYGDEFNPKESVKIDQDVDKILVEVRDKIFTNFDNVENIYDNTTCS